MDYIRHLRSMVGHEKVLMVVAGALVFNEKNQLLLQLRTDSESWGVPGGFMELDESVQDTARREVFEETGLILKEMELFGIYSGPQKHKVFGNGDQAAIVEICFSCQSYEGELVNENKESLSNRFFDLDDLPDYIFQDHQQVIDDVKNQRETPVVG
ncbi:NUDIX domain-containing protein [Halobacillus trueperi]|uniref:NUDIX domain-containing protein n=1 Tax=Halobacillus trueperi TaxID=156205 RepID=A0A3D8VPI7_9BACI|nr:NUDIX domain-containing protein [Halobacillus trueperi]RDY71153.1 NUDIX domain-containing protein [Halobacillus trueperi]